MTSTDLVTVTEVAHELGVSRATVQKLITEGVLIPVGKLPTRTGAYLLAASDIERYKAARGDK